MEAHFVLEGKDFEYALSQTLYYTNYSLITQLQIFIWTKKNNETQIYIDEKNPHTTNYSNLLESVFSTSLLI